MKRWRILLLFSMLLLVGCVRTKKAEGEIVDSADGKTSITWWAFPAFAQDGKQEPGSYEQKLIDAFEKQNPNISVNLEMLDYETGPEKLEKGFAMKTSCDVLLDAPGRIIAYGNAGYLANLNELFTEEYIQDVNNQELIGACRSGEDYYMYPLSSAPFYMAFNRSMLKDAGALELVKDGWTTEEFTQVLKALKEKEYVPGSVFCNGTGGDQGTRAFVANLFDSSVTDLDVTEYTIGNKAGIQAFSYLKAGIDDGLILNGTLETATEAIEDFVYGRCSYSILWGPSQQRVYQKLMDAFDVETVEVSLPSEDGVAALEYLVNGFCVMDQGDAVKMEAAKKFVEFACDDEIWGPKNVIQTGCIPVRSSFGELYEGEERMQTIEAWTDYYVPYYNTVNGFSVMRGYWCEALKDLLSGDASPEGSMTTFAEKANQTL